jgi:ankyrin repeat protein
MNSIAVEKEREAQEIEEKISRIFKENKQASIAIKKNDVRKMEKIFKSGRIEKEAIDFLILLVRSAEMMKLFIRYGGDIPKLGSLIHPRQGSDVNFKDVFGVTPLFYCASRGWTNLCRLLVEHGVDPNTKTDRGKTAMSIAFLNGHLEVLRYLVEECGSSPDALDLRMSIMSGHIDIFRYLAEISGSSVDSMSSGQTHLCLAVLSGQIEVCQYLLEKGAKVDAGRQPLMAAALVF